MHPEQLGSALSPMGISILLSPILCPPIAKRIGAAGLFRLAVCMNALVAVAMPSLRLAASTPPLLWGCLISLSLLRGAGGSFNFIATSILLNELIRDRAGYYNGLNDSVGNCFRALAPLVSGSIFAAATHSERAAFPLDEHLPFYLVSCICLLALALSRGFGRADAHAGVARSHTTPPAAAGSAQDCQSREPDKLAAVGDALQVTCDEVELDEVSTSRG